MGSVFEMTVFFYTTPGGFAKSRIKAIAQTPGCVVVKSELGALIENGWENRLRHWFPRSETVKAFAVGWISAAHPPSGLISRLSEHLEKGDPAQFRPKR
jgi:hypothetical protein